MAKRAAKPVAPDPQDVVRGEFLKQGQDPAIAKKALEDATAVSRALWLSFLTFGTYLVITFAGVDHRDLLLEEPIILPVLNAPLPLVTFFWVAPILFVIFHLYLLLSLKLLADQVHSYVGHMEELGLDGDAQDRARLQLPNFVVVQVLGGTSGQVNSWAGRLLSFTAFLTLVASPLILLLFAQLMFLPYHGWGVTMAHRVMVVVDLVFITYFWRAITRAPEIRFRLWPNVARVAVLVWTFFVFMYPGEFFYNGFAKSLFKEQEKRKLLSFEPSGSSPALALKNTLKLDDVQLFDDVKLKEVAEKNANQNGEFEGSFHTLDLEGRDLRGSDFEGADLRYANLSSANLIDSMLVGTQLVGADLSGALLRSAVLDGADLKGANLSFAVAPGASATFIDLRGASVHFADLRGVDFAFASMNGASFENSDLTVANLALASLDGTIFDDAILIGTNLISDSMNGTSFLNSIVWKNEIDADSFVLSDVSSLNFANRPHGTNRSQSTYTLADFELLLHSAIEEPPWATLDSVFQNFERLNPKINDTNSSANWLEAKEKIAMDSQFPKKLAESLIATACLEEGRPFVAQGIVTGWLSPGREQLDKVAVLLARKLLSGCPGTLGINKRTIKRLRAIVEEIDLEPSALERVEAN